MNGSLKKNDPAPAALNNKNERMVLPKKNQQNLMQKYRLYITVFPFLLSSNHENGLILR